MHVQHCYRVLPFLSPSANYRLCLFPPSASRCSRLSRREPLPHRWQRVGKNWCMPVHSLFVGSLLQFKRAQSNGLARSQPLAPHPQKGSSHIIDSAFGATRSAVSQGGSLSGTSGAASQVASGTPATIATTVDICWYAG